MFRTSFHTKTPEMFKYLTPEDQEALIPAGAPIKLSTRGRRLAYDWFIPYEAEKASRKAPVLAYLDNKSQIHTNGFKVADEIAQRADFVAVAIWQAAIYLLTVDGELYKHNGELLCKEVKGLWCDNAVDGYLLLEAHDGDKKTYYNADGLGKPAGHMNFYHRNCALVSQLSENVVYIPTDKKKKPASYKWTELGGPKVRRKVKNWIQMRYDHGFGSFDYMLYMVGEFPNANYALVRTIPNDRGAFLVHPNDGLVMLIPEWLEFPKGREKNGRFSFDNDDGSSDEAIEPLEYEGGDTEDEEEDCDDETGEPLPKPQRRYVNDLKLVKRKFSKRIIDVAPFGHGLEPKGKPSHYILLFEDGSCYDSVSNKSYVFDDKRVRAVSACLISANEYRLVCLTEDGQIGVKKFALAPEKK